MGVALAIIALLVGVPAFLRFYADLFDRMHRLSERKRKWRK